MKALLILPEPHPYFRSSPTLIAIDVDNLTLHMMRDSQGTVSLTGKYWGPISFDPERPVNLTPRELEQASKTISAADSGNRPTDKEN